MSFAYPRGIQKTKVFFILMTDNYCSIDFVRHYRPLIGDIINKDSLTPRP